MNPFIIDCDTGRDDALTLWLAIKAKLPLVGVVASYGNVELSKVVDNCQRVLSLAGDVETPLMVGADAPCRSHKFVESVVLARHKASGNGLCNLDLPNHPRPTAAHGMRATADYLKQIAAKRGPLDYFIIGPATNCAALIAVLGQDLPRVIASVTMLGGKLPPLWTEVPGADFNVACDPFAVDAVFKSGLPIRLIPLNATWPIFMSLAELEGLRPTTDLAQWAKDLMIAHTRHFAPEPIFRFHDPSVLIAAQAGHLFRHTKLTVICDEASPDFGRMIEDEAGTPCGLYVTGAQEHAQFKADILRPLGFDGV